MPVFVPQFPQVEQFPRLPQKGAPLAEMAELCTTLIEKFGKTIDLCAAPAAVRTALLQGTPGARVWAYHTVRTAFRSDKDRKESEYWATYEEQRQLAMESPMSAMIPHELQLALATILPERGMNYDQRKTLGDAMRAVRSWELQAEQAEEPAHRQHKPARQPADQGGSSGRVRRGHKDRVHANV